MTTVQTTFPLPAPYLWFELTIPNFQSPFEGTKAGYKICSPTTMQQVQFQVAETTDQTQVTLAKNMRHFS